MKNLYYQFWVDAILKTKENPLRKEDWKWMIQIVVATFMALNIILIQFFLSDLGLIKKILMLDINLTSTKKINKFIGFFTTYILPLLLLNYFLIFYNGKYKKLIETYPYKNGKWIKMYIFCSSSFFLLYILIAFLVVMFQSW